MNNLFTESKYELTTPFSEKTWGCNLITDKKYREWCFVANSKLSEKGVYNSYIKKVKKEVNDFKPFISEKYEKKLKEYIKEFDENDDFFKENLKNVNILKENLKYCSKSSKKINEFIENQIKPNFLFVYPETTEMVYDIINKFNSNYTAISYLLTKTLQLKNKDVTSLDFEIAFEEYFIDKINGQSNFYLDLMSYLNREGLDVNEKFDGVIHTIKKTSEKGLLTEEKFEKYLKSKNFTINVNYKVFAGDFSFVDLMGVDLMVKDENQLWIPIQVKTNIKDCRNNHRFCKNFCVAPNGNFGWSGYKYNGVDSDPIATLTF